MQTRRHCDERWARVSQDLHVGYGRRRAANVGGCSAVEDLPWSGPAVDECVSACSSPERRSCEGCAAARSADGAGLLLSLQGGGSCSYSGRVVWRSRRNESLRGIGIGRFSPTPTDLLFGAVLFVSARPISTTCPPFPLPLPASPTSAIVGFFDHDVSRETIERPHDFDAPSRPPAT